jgi:hypothetical protein
VLVNDSDPDETPGGLSVVSASSVSGDGSVSLTGSIVTITPQPDFVGEVVATYTISDGEGLTATSRVTLRIEPPLNRPPDARDDAVEVVNGGSTRTAVLLNDNDPDGDSLSVTIVGSPDPALGNANLNSDRTISFTATPGASGTANVTYEVSDGTLTDTATLRIAVRPCAESTPVANDGFLRTGYQQPIAVDLGAYIANGDIVELVGPSGYVNGVYTPPAGENGNVAITYTVVNSCRLRASGQVTIDVNQDPVAQPRTIEVVRGSVREVPVTDLATDAEPLVIAAAPSAPSWATVETSRLVVAPPTDATAGSSSFDVTVSDPGGLSTTVRVTVVVRNAAPTAVADTIDLAGGGSQTVAIVDNDTDADGTNAALSIRTVPSTVGFSAGGSATIVVSADRRSVTVTLDGALGEGLFGYTVEDADGAVSAEVQVRVIAPPPPTTTTTTTTTTLPPATTVPASSAPPVTTVPSATTIATTTVP